MITTLPPAPWRADHDRTVRSATGGSIAEVISGGCESSVQADAMLRAIVNLPYLITALRGCVDVMRRSRDRDDPTTDGEWHAALEVAQAVLVASGDRR